MTAVHASSDISACFDSSTCCTVHCTARGSYSTKNVPWWAWLGGACGGFYVLIVVIAIPKYVCRTAHAVMCVHACACILRCVTLQWRTCEAMFNAIVLSHNVCTI
jgi:Putative inner membrane exporter, YdcZ